MQGAYDNVTKITNYAGDPTYIHRVRLKTNAEYRLLFADHIYRRMFNGGPLSVTGAKELYQHRLDMVDRAVAAESARWGDNRYDQGSVRYTRSYHWINQKNWLMNTYFPWRTNTVLWQLKSENLYPYTNPPAFSINGSLQYGGTISNGDLLTMTNPNGSGTIYYTLDNSDPREYWTGSAAGTTYSSAVSLGRSVRVKARVLDGGEWSALSEAVFGIPTVAENLRITELMYHPQDEPAGDPNTEFIELKHIGDSGDAPINLNLVSFTNGVEYTFDSSVQLDPGDYVVVVKNRTAFAAQYNTSGMNIAPGQYVGSLDNGGEEIDLDDALGTEIHDFDYEDSWYELTDGLGFSLTMVNPNSADPNDWGQKSGWRSSLSEGGTPGRSADTVLAADSIVINELLAHSHGIEPDWIELYNKTEYAINIGGWFLSDDDSDPDSIRKYEIPADKFIAGHGYLVFYEDASFGSLSLPEGKGFGLSEGGETLYLYSGENGEVTGYYQTQQKFDASETDISFGRYEKTELSGGYDFVRMNSWTIESVNSDPLPADIVITEIHYHPSSGTDYEYVELYNRSGASITLMTEVTTYTSETNSITEWVAWRLEGTGFEFPSNTTIAADEYVIVAKDPTKYTSASCAVYGPYDGKLSNGGEEIEIQMPGDQEYGKDRYWIPIEKVDYDDAAPWYVSADGDGDSLQRLNVDTYGRDYSNWEGALPSPGEE